MRLIFSGIFVFLLIMTSSFTYAASSLNRIDYQLQLEHWVVTNTAQVSISVNATANNHNLAQTQAQILTKLNGLIKKTTWNITDMSQSEDRSGLEKIHLSATTRLPNADIMNLRARIKSISKAGEQFQLQAINFQPGLIDIEKTRNLLRQQIYRQVKAEVARLNRIYPRAHYFVHQINFMPVQPIFGRQNALVKISAAVPQPNMMVKREVMVSAHVELAAKS